MSPASRNHSTPGRRVLAAVLLAALVVTSCVTSPQPVVKVGLIAPFEGLYREDAYAVLAAVKLAIAERNAAGGVAGRRVTLVALNDNDRAADAAARAAELAIDPDVAGVIAPFHRPTARAAASGLAQAGLPYVTLASLDPAEQAGGLGLEAPSSTLAEQATALLAAGGITRTVVLTNAAALPPAAAGVVWLGDAAGGATLAQQLGPAVALIGGPELGSPVFARRVGADAAPVRWLSAAPLAAALPTAFVDAYTAQAGYEPPPLAALAYDAANVLLDALAEAGPGSNIHRRAGVAHGLAHIAATGWDGLSGTATWQPADPCPPAGPCFARLVPSLTVHPGVD